jgi:hypothetical protein
MQICTTDEWMSPESLCYISQCLEACADISMIEDLRRIFPREALASATKNIDSAQKRRLRQWVIELNNNDRQVAA